MVEGEGAGQWESKAERFDTGRSGPSLESRWVVLGEGEGGGGSAALVPASPSLEKTSSHPWNLGYLAPLAYLPDHRSRSIGLLARQPPRQQSPADPTSHQRDQIPFTNFGEDPFRVGNREPRRPPQVLTMCGTMCTGGHRPVRPPQVLTMHRPVPTSRALQEALHPAGPNARHRGLELRDMRHDPVRHMPDLHMTELAELTTTPVPAKRHVGQRAMDSRARLQREESESARGYSFDDARKRRRVQYSSFRKAPLPQLGSRTTR